MPVTRLLGVLLLVGGVAAIIYGGFVYSPEAVDIAVGPLEMTVGEADQVNTPLWVGIVAVVGGIVLMLIPTREQTA